MQIANPRGADPEKILGLLDGASRNRVELDVFDNFFKLDGVSDEAIVAFVPPERLPGTLQNLVAFPRRESLKRVQDFRDISLRRKQQMDVICHDNEGVKIVLDAVAATNRVHHQFGERWLAKIEGSRTASVQDLIHGDERFPRRRSIWIASAHWQAAVQPPRYEERLSDGAEVRQMANAEIAHTRTLRYGSGISH